MFDSVKEMTDALKPAATVLSDRVSVTSVSAASPELVDKLAWTAAFGGDAELRGTARWIIRSLAAAAGIRPASIHDLYMAMGRGEAGGFTVPAINVRAMAYDTARAVVRSAKNLDAGAFIFEIARSEIGYTEQRPHEYAAIVLAAALREGFSGPIFIQGDHVQTNAKKYNSPERDKELETLRALIKEEIAAGFYNIDIDTSTLVDLDEADARRAAGSQRHRSRPTSRPSSAKHEPQGVTVSVGGEIGEVGGKNSDVHELHAYMDGFNRKLKERGARPGRPQQDQRPDRHRARRLRQRRRHGADRRRRSISRRSRSCRAWRARSTAWPAPSSTARRRCRRRRSTRSRASAPARSTSPPTSRTWSTSTRSSRPISRPRCTPGFARTRTEERKPKDTEEQFIYKARKKALGPFKRRMWGIDDAARPAIGQSLEERFTFLMRQLKIDGTAAAGREVRHARAGADRSRGRNRRRRRQDHGGREEGRRARGRQ